MSTDNTTAITSLVTLPKELEWQNIGKKHLRNGKSGAIWAVGTGLGKNHLAMAYGQEADRLAIFAPTSTLMRQLRREGVKRFGRPNVCMMNRESGFNPYKAVRSKCVIGSSFAPPALMQHLGDEFSGRYPKVFIDEVQKVMCSEELQLLMGRVARKCPKTQFILMSGSLHEKDIRPLGRMFRARKVIRQSKDTSAIKRHVVMFEAVKDDGQPVNTIMTIDQWNGEKLVEVHRQRFDFEINSEDKATATALVLDYIRNNLKDARTVMAYSRRQKDINELVRNLLAKSPAARPELEEFSAQIPKGDTDDITLFRESMPKGIIPVHSNVHRDCLSIADELLTRGLVDVAGTCLMGSVGTNFRYGSAIIMTAEDSEFGFLEASEHEQVLGRISRLQINDDGTVLFPHGNSFVIVFNALAKKLVEARLLKHTASEIDAKITNPNKLAPYVIEWIQEGHNTRSKLLKCMKRHTLWGLKGASDSELLGMIDLTFEFLADEEKVPEKMLERRRKKRSSHDYFTVTEWGELMTSFMISPIELMALRIFTEEGGDFNSWVSVLATIKNELTPLNRGSWEDAIDDVIKHGLLTHSRKDVHRMAGQFADYVMRMADLASIYLKRRNAGKDARDQWRERISKFCLIGSEWFREGLTNLQYPMCKRLLRRCGHVIVDPQKAKDNDHQLVVSVAFEELQDEPRNEWIEALAQILFVSTGYISALTAQIRETAQSGSEKTGKKKKKDKKELRGGGASGSSGNSPLITLDTLKGGE